MGLSGVATSNYPNGPYALRKSFYPDAPMEAPGGVPINETHDQTVFIDPDSGVAYLIRTYYKTINHWLPRAVMNPQWESVKDENGDVDFGLNYHRGVYHEAYDDVDDIYLQRWRKEDKEWEIRCCNKMNECSIHKEIPSTLKSLLKYHNKLMPILFLEKGDVFLCPSGTTKEIIGQGLIPIKSKYKVRKSQIYI